MIKSFRYASLALIAFVIISCSQKIGLDAVSLPPIVNVDTIAQKYNIQMDFMKHHLSGILIVRRMTDKEIRIVCSTYFGPSLFDLSLQGDSLKVNSCMEPMRKKNVLHLLEADFNAIFLSQKTFKIKKKEDNFEKRTKGCGFSKSIIKLSKFARGYPECICIKHPWIWTKIRLEKLNESTETNDAE
ncbi:hypothetical protein [uncultured Bacteroides sp.]|uniref:hypothetical protein n=1 Tax=uncultured Bacteroides sp. TaxID=162156 RepID=UPI002AAAD940|nr:hypothetical protein [uncultured Bacteroides sp.]